MDTFQCVFFKCISESLALVDLPDVGMFKSSDTSVTQPLLPLALPVFADEKQMLVFLFPSWFVCVNSLSLSQTQKSHVAFSKFYE